MLRGTIVVYLFILVTTITGCSQVESSKYEVPSEYSHANRILIPLQEQGIKIQEIKNSNYMGLFQTQPNDAMFIRTDSGVFELIYHENENGNQITIENKTAPDGRFKYIITRNGKEQTFDSNEELFFNQTDEYITITREKELDEILKKVFRMDWKVSPLFENPLIQS